MNYKTPYIVSCKDITVFNKTVIADVRNTAKLELPNKYLFLGPQGAILWAQIDKKYRASADGAELLSDHFSTIDQIVFNSNNNKSYDVVSLGIGIGTDDINILAQIQSLQKDKLSNFNIYAVDLSLALLRRGVSEIDNFLKTEEIRKNIKQIYGIWTDFEDLSLSENKTYLNLNINFGKNRALYHLLGLTLGNNKESKLLSAIHECMEPNDFLLLGVDFCADGDETIITKAEDIYTKGESSKIINKFLCNQLYFASEFKLQKSDYSQKQYKLTLNNLFSDVDIIHDRNYDGKYSDVKDSISFTRYHRTGGMPLRLCDFSTKYKKNNFKDFIEKELKSQLIHFEWIDCYHAKKNPEKNTQVLILLKKIKKAETQTSSTKFNEKIITQAISQLNQINKTAEAHGKSDIIDTISAFLKTTQHSDLAQCINDKNSLDVIIKEYNKRKDE